MKIQAALSTTMLLVVSPTSADASPWTLEPGNMLLSMSFDFARADQEYLDGGGAQAFPLDGEFFGASMTLTARIGLTDRAEIAASLPIRWFQYASDAVILGGNNPGEPSPDVAFFQDRVVDFSRTAAGIGDISLWGRYKLLDGPLVVTGELRLKTPTGYDGPEGTFGAEPTTVEGFEAQRETLIRADNVRDDVAIGDGQLDISGSLLVGKAFSFGTFVRGAVGYNWRHGGAGDQILADIRVGQAVGASVMLYAGAQLEYAIEDGRIIGISVVAEDPARPAIDFAREENLRAFARPLERDALDLSGGLIWRLADRMELNLGYQRTLWGRLVARTDVFSISYAWRTSLFEGPGE